MANLYLSFFSYFSICASVFLLFSITEIYSIGGNEIDQQALLDFRDGIGSDPFGVVSSWNSTTHFCQWFGVTCGRRNQRVTVLNLTSSKLEGTISPSIGNLSFLKVLSLQNNSLTHKIPPEIGRLGSLQILYLSNNSLTGPIPSNISKCPNLVVLDLFNNHLTGKVPVELGSLTKLQLLFISKNNLTGTLPSSLGNLSSLIGLYAAKNNFVGNIPESFGQLKNLIYFGLLQNNLYGIIPSSIFNLSSLVEFEVALNNFEGSLPSDLFTSLPNLQTLNLAANQFTGPIPISISNATKLAYLHFGRNNLTGKVPSLERLNIPEFYINRNNLGNQEVDDLRFLCSLTNSSVLQWLYVDRNNFGGSLPECIGNLSSKLEEFTLYENQISGSVPTSIGNLINLAYLDVYDNKLSGIIPESIGNLRNMVIFYFSKNKFSGPIPTSLGNLTKLNELYLADNYLLGAIPSSLAKCTYLKKFDLSRNNLSGTIPPEVIGLSSLSVAVSFAQNHFTGPLPIEVGNLKALGTLDISDNMLSSEIPTSLGSCTSLERLYMNNNRFQGSIPFSLSSLKGLQDVDFSHNNLSGQIPRFFAQFDSLLMLNLSFNNFEGMMATDGVFKNASVTSVTGNKLCGGMPEFQLPSCHIKRSNKRRLKVIIAAIVGILGAILVVLPFLCCLMFKRKRKNFDSSNSEKPLLDLPRVSYNDIHKATDGFSSANLTGSGGFGSVYKGILGEGGQIVAIKVLNLQNHGATKSFMAECEALRNVKHRNLVKIVTACSSVDNKGNDFKALVYEFMANGSLEQWLHPPFEVHEMRERDKNLNLIQRINIAIDVAFAIEYLHHNSTTPIVHCDLKPSNVLLDAEMTAHVGDFGLAKILLHDILNNTTNLSNSAALRGTIGYAPPEYGLGSEVSIQGDVYSYGILLMEIFTGKRPTDDMFKEGWNLHKFVKSALPNVTSAIVDPTLLQETSIDMSGRDDQIMMECLSSILEIGISSSIESPVDRMDISEASRRLCLIRDKLQKNLYLRK